MSFHDVIFPTGFLYGATASIEYRTQIITTRAGHEQRNVSWLDPLRSWDIAPCIKDQQDLDVVVAFFRARGGPQNSFRVRNFLDFTVTDAPLGTGDGVRTAFQLYLTHSTGVVGDTYSAIQLITKPRFGTVVLSAGGVPQTAGVDYNLDHATGLATFTVPVADTVVLTWTGEYDYPMFFESDDVAVRIAVFENFFTTFRLIEERVSPLTQQWTEAAIPDFVEARFFDEVTPGTSFGPRRRVLIIEDTSGATERLAPWTEGRITGVIQEQTRSPALLRAFMTLFHARKARATGFRLRDLTDFQLTNELIGVGDGATAVFQITKTYVDTGGTEVKPITKPVAAGNSLTVGGLPQTDGVDYTLDTTTGQLTFTTIPPALQDIRITITYDIPVRLDTDQLELVISGFDVGSLRDLSFVEIRPESIPGVDLVGQTGRPTAGVTGCGAVPLLINNEVGAAAVQFDSLLPDMLVIDTAADSEPLSEGLQGAAAFTAFFVMSDVSLNVSNDPGTLFRVVGKFNHDALLLDLPVATGPPTASVTQGNLHGFMPLVTISAGGVYESTIPWPGPIVGADIILQSADMNPLGVNGGNFKVLAQPEPLIIVTDNAASTPELRPIFYDVQHPVPVVATQDVGTGQAPLPTSGIIVVGFHVNYDTRQAFFLGHAHGGQKNIPWAIVAGYQHQTGTSVKPSSIGGIAQIAGGDTNHFNMNLYEVILLRHYLPLTIVATITDAQRYLTLKYTRGIPTGLSTQDLMGWWEATVGVDVVGGQMQWRNVFNVIPPAQPISHPLPSWFSSGLGEAAPKLVSVFPPRRLERELYDIDAKLLLRGLI